MFKISRWVWVLLGVGSGFFIATQSLIATLSLGTFITVVVAISFSPLAILNILVVLAPLRTLVATESSLHLPLDIGQALFIVYIVTWTGWKILRRDPLFRWRTSLVYTPIIGFLLASGATVFSAASLSAWINEWLKWMIILALVIILLHEVDDRWHMIVFGLIVAGTANAIIGLYIFFGGSGADHLLINSRYFRAFGTFGQPNPFGGFMGMLIPLASMMAYGYTNRMIRIWKLRKPFIDQDFIWAIFYGLGTIVMIGGLIASWSRGAWLGFIVAAAAMAFALPKRFWQSIVMSSIVLALVAISWSSGLLPNTIKVRVSSSATELFQISDVRGVDITTANYAIIERLAHWQAAQNMARDTPWLGVGLGNYEIVYDQYRLLNWHEALGHAHNYYLNILAEAGIIGFFVYVAMWVSILLLTWQARSHPDTLSRSVAVGLFGTWSYLAVHNMLDNLYVNNLFIHLGVMLGLLAILHHQTYQAHKWR